MKRLIFTCITFLLSSLTMYGMDYYWVGGTGNWSDFGTHWATTSGGGTFHTLAPTQNDDVYFDANSFGSAGLVVTIHLAAHCNDMDWTGASNSPEITGSASLSIYGSLTLIPGMTFSYSGITYFKSLSTGQTITMAGQSFNDNIDFDGIGSWLLQDALIISGSYTLKLVNGTLNTNGQDVTVYRFNSKYTSTRTLTLGSSIMTLTYASSSAFEFNGTNMTVNPGTSLIKFTSNNGGMSYSTTGGVDFYDILCESAGGTSYIRNQGGTFHDITFNSASGRLYYGATINKVVFNQLGNIYYGTFIIDTVEFKGEALISSGGHTFGRVYMEGDGTITGSNTFDDLLELSEGYTYTFDDGATQTFNGDLIAVGTCFDPINIQSSSGTQANFIQTSGPVTVTRVTLANMNATGATFTANESYDLGNNTGWNITTPASLDLYWIGGTGDWDDPAHWSTTSGGTGGACLPTLVDSVFFDANSFTAASQTVTLIGDGNDNVACKSMDWTNAGFSPSLSGASALKLKINGSLTLVSAMTWNHAGYTHFESENTGNTVTSAGNNFNNNIYFDGVGGEWTLQDVLSLTGEYLYLINGTLNTNDQDVTASKFYSKYTNNRTLNLGSSIMTLTLGSSEAFDFNGTNMTINPGTSLIKFTSTSGGMNYTTTGGVDFYDILCESAGGTSHIRNQGGTFHDITFNSATGYLRYGAAYIHKVIFNQAGVIYSANATYKYDIDTVEFNGTGKIDDGGHTFGHVYMDGDGQIDGSNTFDELLELSEGHTYTFDDGATQTFNGDLIAVGTCFDPINIQSSSGTQANFIQTSGPVTVTRVTLANMNATGATFTANESFDLGNNSGWIINTPASDDLYWVGGTGDWNDPNHWSTSSGGTGGACLPTLVDNVFFDANSFTAASQTVTLIGDGNDNVACKSMDWTNAGFSPSLSGASALKLKINGSLTLVSAMTWNHAGYTHFESENTGNTVTSAGNNFNNNIYFDGVGGEWTLQDVLSLTGEYLYLINGTLNTNDQDVTASKFYSKYTNNRTLNLGSSIMTLTLGSSEAFDFNGTNMTINPGTSLIKFTSTSGGMNYTTTGGVDFYDILCESAGGTSHIRNQGGTFHDITFNSATGYLRYGAAYIHKVIFNQAGVIYSANATYKYDIDTVEFNGTGKIDDGGHTFGHVYMDGDGQIDGSNTFDELLQLFEGSTYTFQAGQTQTFNGDLVAVGTCFDPINIQSSSGTQANFIQTSGPVTVTRVTLANMNATGATFTANESYDLGNNTGWNITTPASLDLYWIGGTGDWDDPAHWSTTSGGTGGACLPTLVDSVFFDANSFTAASQTVTLIGDGNDNVACKSMDWTNAGFSPSLSGASALKLKINGSLTLVSAMTWNHAGYTHFESENTGNTVTSAGNNFNNNIYFDGVGGEWTLQDVLSLTGEYLYLINGTLNTNDQDVTASKFYSKYTNNRTLNLGSSIMTLTLGSSEAFDFNGTNMTINPGTSLIKFTSTSGGMNYTTTGGVDFYDILCESAGGTSHIRNQGGTFHDITFNSATGYLRYGAAYIHKVIFNQAGVIYSANATYKYDIDTVEFNGFGKIDDGGHTFGHVYMNGDGQIDGSNTFDYLEFSPGNTYSLQSGQTQTINDDFVADGSCASAITIQSSSSGNAATISKATETVTIRRVNLKDNTAAGGATFNASGCNDNGGNTGWNFTPIEPEDLYWVGGTGDWSDISHWASGSGGTGGYCLPTTIDNVYFDANSFDNISQVVYVDIANVEVTDMDWTGVTNNPGFSSNSNLYNLKINGSLTLASIMNFAFDGDVFFQSTSAGNTVDMSGFLFNDDVQFNGVGGEWTLLSNTGSSGNNSLTVSDGLLDLGSYLYESSGTTIIDGGTLKLSDNSLLEVGANDSIVVRTGGTLEVLGSAGNEATIKGYNDQNYIFRVRSGGTISAEHAVFRHMKDKGLYVRDGATVDAGHPFDYCTFEEGSLGGASTLLTIDNNQTLTIDHATFPNNTWSGDHNVGKIMNQGHLTFTNASGNFAGIVFEDDVHGLIDWPGLYSGEWTGNTDELWHDATNWYYHYFPDTASQVTIPGGSPNYPKVVTYDETCNGLIIQSGAHLEVNDKTLTVNGDAEFHGKLKMVHAQGVFDVTGDLLWKTGSEEHVDGVTAGIINLDGDLYLDNGTDVNIGSGNTMNLDGSPNCTIYSNDASASLGKVVSNCDTYYDLSGTQPLHITGDLEVNESFFMQNNLLIVDGDLDILNVPKRAGRGTGKLVVSPTSSVTAGGNVTIDSPEGIDIQADASNTGSFIGNSDYTYGTGGSIKISTYFYNDPASGHDYHYHQVGPLVNDPATGYTGVPLDAFNIEIDTTYAYIYDNATNNWINIYVETTPVNSTDGLMLTTDDNTSYTLSMTGEFNAGDAAGSLYTPASLPLGYSLISNPFSSAVDFDAFYLTNTVPIGGTNDFYYVWHDGAVGNYKFYSVTSGGDAGQYIPVGSGMFVDLGESSAQLQYLNPPAANHHRVHQNLPLFKSGKVYMNRLVLRVAGNNFQDENIIHFYENASNSFFEGEDLYKWYSMLDNATEIWMAVDGNDLSLNCPEPLENDAYSVPLHFKCGASGQYTITASDIQSFNGAAEIWLEDILTGAPWHNLVDNPVYTFAANPDDARDRFIVHFFGTAGLDELDAESPVTIYSFQEYAYIVNKSNEVIKEFVVYNMIGYEIMRGSLPKTTVNRIYIDEGTAYFIVKVITDKNVHTGKVLIMD